MTVRYRIVVRGRVQRVSFRANTRRRALALNLIGFARNQPDGSVEVLAQGAEHDVQTLIDWLHRGPMLARVDSVTCAEEAVTGMSEEGFKEY